MNKKTDMIDLEDIRGFLEADSATENNNSLFESAKSGQPEIKLEKLNSNPIETPQKDVKDAEI